MQLKDAIKGHLLDLKIGNTSKSHMNEVSRELERFRRWCEAQKVLVLDAVTPMILKSYMVNLQELTISQEDPRISMRGRKISPVTALDYMRKVRTFFFWAEREGYLTGINPINRIPKIKVPEKVFQAFAPEQLVKLLEHCDLSTPLGFRDYTIILVMLDSGIRVSELCTLTLDSIKDDYLVVFGKGSKEREVGLGSTASRELFKYVHQYRKPELEDERRVFLSHRGRPLDRKKIWQMIHDIAEAAGIKGVRSSPHTVRHTFTKEWLVKGGDLASVSRLLGHTDIQTTQIYMKSFQSHEARSQHSKFSPVESNKLGRRTANRKGKKKPER